MPKGYSRVAVLKDAVRIALAELRNMEHEAGVTKRCDRTDVAACKRAADRLEAWLGSVNTKVLRRVERRTFAAQFDGPDDWR